MKENVINFIKAVCAVEEVPEEAVENYRKLLEELSDREERIVRLRYGLDDGICRTLEEVAKEFGVTREKIRQVEAKAIKKLRHPARVSKLGIK